VPISLRYSLSQVSWQEEIYRGKEIGDEVPEIYSDRGERVRSKSEKMIADKLFQLGIPYKYEAPLILEPIGRVYPDFTILNKASRKEIYWEHLGMMDNPEYAEKAVRKINTYESNGKLLGRDVILTFETMRYPLDMRRVEEMLRGMGIFSR